MKKANDSGLRVGAAGIAAIAALAAGAYFLYGKDGAKHRKMVRGWTLKAKGEILEQIERMDDMSKENYGAAIDKIAAKYAAMKGVDKKELALLVKELKSHWRAIKNVSVPKK